MRPSPSVTHIDVIQGALPSPALDELNADSRVAPGSRASWPASTRRRAAPRGESPGGTTEKSKLACR